MYEEPEKKSDNEALNELVNVVKSINKKIGLFYWLFIASIVITLIALIAPHVTWA